MPRQKPDMPATTWRDVSDCVPAWEREKGVRITVQLAWKATLPKGAYVEVVIWDASATFEELELMRVRHPFPTLQGAGHPGAVLYAIFDALNRLDAEPWSWSRKMRRDANAE